MHRNQKIKVLRLLPFTIQFHTIIMHRNWEFIDRHTCSLYLDQNLVPCQCADGANAMAEVV